MRPDNKQAEYYEHAERARRLDVLQRAENEFDPIPFDTEAARAFGQVTAAVRATGRTPRRRTADLMIASTAASLPTGRAVVPTNTTCGYRRHNHATP